MVPVSTVIACVATLFVSLVLPFLTLIGFAIRNKKQGILSAWILGAAGFIVTQLCIRLPILTALSGMDWFVSFSQEHLFAYAVSLSFTAGLFELAGRFAVAKILQKKLTWNRALATGLGHGGIEAMVIVGIAYINNLAYIALIHSGAFDAMLTQLPADQAAYMESIRVSLTTMGAGNFYLAGFERILTMIVHTALSVLVCWGVKTGKPGKCTLICITVHTFIDLTAGISLLTGTTLTQTTAYTLIFTILTTVAVLSFFILKDIRRRWQEVDHVQ